MKRTGIQLIVFLLLLNKLHAQDTTVTAPSAYISTQTYKMAIGVRLSSRPPAINNAVTFKYFLTEKTAVEALLSFDPIAIGVLLEKHRSFGPQGLSWFLGGGAYIGFGSDRNVGLQGVVGLDYKAPYITLNLTLDWKPELNVAKEFSFEPAAVAISARFTIR
ncbi:MAG: hypothetical protein ACJ748_13310 [Flavisolibacter sp.]